MFAIKISFKGRNFLLGKGIDSFDKIITQVVNRFPGQCSNGASFKYCDRQLDNFQQVKNIVSENGMKTIKIEVVPLEQKKLQVVKQNEQKEQQKVIVSEEIIKQKKDQEVKQNKQEKVEQQQNNKQQNLAIVSHVDIVLLQNESKDQKLSSEDKEQHIDKFKNFQQTIDHISEKESKIEIKQFNGELCKIKSTQSVQLNINQLRPCQQEQKKVQQVLLVKQIQQTNHIVTIKFQVKQDQQIKDINEQIKDIKEQKDKKEQKDIQIEIDLNKQVLQPLQKQQIQQDNYIQVQQPQQQRQRQKPQIKQQQSKPQEQSKINEQDIQRWLCRVFERQGKINQNCRFIKLLQGIVDKRIQKRLTQLNIVAKVQQVEEDIEQKKVQNKQYVQDFNYKNVLVQVSNLQDNKNFYNIGDMIEWKFILNTDKLPENTKNINVIDEKTGMTTDLKLFNGKNILKLGPYPALFEGKFQKTFRLFYFKEQEQMQYFGPKFGFTVNVQNGIEKKRLTNKFRIDIDKKKKQLKVNKQTEYIIERLKEMGINEQNFEQSLDFLGDILQTI